MGEKLLQYYKYVTEKNGLSGKMHLAVETKIPSTSAALAPDTPENLALFRKAVEKITGSAPPAL